MALKKLFTQENGIATEYHKVTRVTFIDNNGEYPSEDKIPLTLQVKLTSYLNEGYRKSGHSIDSEMYIFDITDEEEETLGIRKLAYAKLKELDTFADAEDC